MSIDIQYADDQGDYALHYKRQRLPQPGGVAISPEDRILRPFCNTEIGTIPFLVFNNRILWFPIPDTMHTKVSEFNRLLDKVEPYADALCNEYERGIISGTIVGLLTAKGWNIKDKISDICSGFQCAESH